MSENSGELSYRMHKTNKRGEKECLLGIDTCPIV
jgi:hypothetical protein